MLEEITVSPAPGKFLTILRGFDSNWPSLRPEFRPVYYVLSRGRYSREFRNMLTTHDRGSAKSTRDWLANSPLWGELFDGVYLVDSLELIPPKPVVPWPRSLVSFDPGI